MAPPRPWLQQQTLISFPATLSLSLLVLSFDISPVIDVLHRGVCSQRRNGRPPIIVKPITDPGAMCSNVMRFV